MNSQTATACRMSPIFIKINMYKCKKKISDVEIKIMLRNLEVL